MENKKYEILVFGAGVIGSVFGGLLAKAGHKVTLLARGSRLDQLRKNGLLLKNKENDVENITTLLAETLEPQNIYDFIFVTLRREQVSAALPVLAKNRSQCFVFMVNTADGYSEWEEKLGPERIIAAFPGAGGKIEDSVVHYELTSRLVQPTTFGEVTGKLTSRVKTLQSILKHAGFETAVKHKMDVWQKCHVAMVGPMAYGIYFGGNNYSLAKSKVALSLMAKALQETFGFLHDSGIGIRPAKLNIFRYAPVFILRFVFAIMFNTKWAETVLSNHALNARKEMKMLTESFLQFAENAGYQLPSLRKMYDAF